MELEIVTQTFWLKNLSSNRQIRGQNIKNGGKMFNLEFLEKVTVSDHLHCRDRDTFIVIAMK